MVHFLRCLFFVQAKYQFSIVGRHIPGVQNSTAEGRGREGRAGEGEGRRRGRGGVEGSGEEGREEEGMEQKRVVKCIQI